MLGNNNLSMEERNYFCALEYSLMTERPFYMIGGRMVQNKKLEIRLYSKLLIIYTKKEARQSFSFMPKIRMGRTKKSMI